MTEAPSGFLREGVAGTVRYSFPMPDGSDSGSDESICTPVDIDLGGLDGGAASAPKDEAPRRALLARTDVEV